MTRFGVDYAWGDPGPAALKAAGATFVCRYVSTRGNTKNLRPEEAAALRKAGIDIVVVFETSTTRALHGKDAGYADALSAEAQAKACGAPDDCVIYLAVDFNPGQAEMRTVLEYLRGAGSALGVGRIGVYGGISVVKAAFDAGLVAYGWQTYAWSANKWDARAQIQQYHNGGKINGVSVDYNRTTADDFGQWDRTPVEVGWPIPHRQPNRLPGPLHKPAWFWAALKEFLRRRKRGTTAL